MEKDRRDREMRNLIKQMNTNEAIDSLDKFTLKFYFKKPESKLFGKMDPHMAAEAEKAALMKLAPANMNVHSMLAE